MTLALQLGWWRCWGLPPGLARRSRGLDVCPVLGRGPGGASPGRDLGRKAGRERQRALWGRSRAAFGGTGMGVCWGSLVVVCSVWSVVVVCSGDQWWLCVQGVSGGCVFRGSVVVVCVQDQWCVNAGVSRDVCTVLSKGGLVVCTGVPGPSRVWSSLTKSKVESHFPQLAPKI